MKSVTKIIIPAIERFTRYFQSSDVNRSWLSRIKMANTFEKKERMAVELNRMTSAICHSTSSNTKSATLPSTYVLLWVWFKMLKLAKKNGSMLS